jgi:hypothetical protein
MTFKEYLEEQNPMSSKSKQSLLVYIANNLYRYGARKDANPTSILLLMAAATMLNASDDPQSVAAARRIAQLAISKKN